MIDDLLERNRAWAAGKVATDSQFFSRLVAQQSPRYMWIGCADSRVPANEIVGLDPGEMFVHRNVANIASPHDINYLSTLQYAVEVLGVTDVLVVGHYGCGGVAAAVDGADHGLVDHWIEPIRDIARDHKAELEAITDAQARADRLVELNVMHQACSVARTSIVQRRRKAGHVIDVHAWAYSLRTGLVTPLQSDLTKL